MRVLKFGGSSLASPERVRHVAGLVAAARRAGPVAVVVSAFGGVTNDLLAAADAAAARDEGDEENGGWEGRWRRLAARHRDAVGALAPAAAEVATQVVDEVESLLAELHDLLHGVFLLRECSPRSRDGIASYGERLSAILLAATLRGAGVAARARDARELIRTDDAFGRARVDHEITARQVRAALAGAGEGSDEVAVVTGFIGASEGGHTTTLGRGGSDYTAALIGAALDAEAIELWTDVDGVLSADPRLVPDAFPLPRISYAELMELSHFGAKVVYPPTVHPARAGGIPLVIKNTLDPAAAGTRVEERAPPAEHAVRGVASIPRVALLRLEGDGMVGVPGVASRLFGALAARGLSVILISQASSEHSICFAVAPEDAEPARAAVDEAFALERRAGLVDGLVVEADLSVLAAVGEALRHRPGIAGRLFGILGDAGVNVHAIAQGSSELNISLVVAERDAGRALRAVHDAFFQPPRRRVRIALAGVGRVGSALLAQLEAAREGLRRIEGLELVPVMAANSRGVRFLESDESDESERSDQSDLSAALQRARTAAPGSLVLVDCTASDDIAARYPALLASGTAVVAANKRAFAGPQAAWDALAEAARRGGVPLRFEAAVGAGLPVLGPLRDLVASGDRVLRIDGVLSGTANAVLDRIDRGGEALSAAVRWAHAEGLTEPHPWDDLSGADVGRKLLILARLAGLRLEPEDVAVEPLVAGDGWAELDLEAFWRALPGADAAFAARQAAAREAGRRLRYVATLDAGAKAPAARVALEAVGPEHPAYDLRGADNVIAIASERYRASPLVVRGPGAGPEVTAAGVFADLLAVARALRPASSRR